MTQGMNDGAIFALLDDASPDASPPARSRLYRDYAGMLACHAVEEWPRCWRACRKRWRPACTRCRCWLRTGRAAARHRAAARSADGHAAGPGAAVPRLRTALGDEVTAWLAERAGAAARPASPTCAATSTKRPSRAPSNASATTSPPATPTRSTTPTGSASTPSVPLRAVRAPARAPAGALRRPDRPAGRPRRAVAVARAVRAPRRRPPAGAADEGHGAGQRRR
jgi:hypothetical protein